MILYIINFVLCSGLLWSVYRLFLAGEHMYRFNRFYLLFGMVFSLIVPFARMGMPVTVVPAAYQQVFTPAMATPSQLPQQRTVSFAQTPSANYLSIILSITYGVIALVLLGRFFVNLYRIKKAALQNTSVQYHDAKLILIEAEVTPHSFLNNIFINKYDYHDGLIEPEIICHEQAHVRQLHSLDVLLVELLQAVCWFNPFIWLYRRDIQLNHEFLADEAVIASYHNTAAYQYLLLARASAANSLQLTSQFNYLTTKKRLIMMTKNTSASIALAKQLALVPVIALALFLFGQKVDAQSASPKTVAIERKVPAAPQPAGQSVTDEYTAILTRYGTGTTPKGRVYQKTNFSAADKIRLVELFKQMNVQQQKQQKVLFMPVGPPLSKTSPSDEQLAAWKNPREYGVWIDGKKISNNELSNYKAADFDQVFVSRLTNQALHHNEYHYQVDLMTKTYYADYYKKAKARMGEYLAWVRMPLITESK